MSPSSKNILFQISGSIAAYKACEVISWLVKEGHQVRCVATPSALKFVGGATLEGLTGHPVFSDVFASGQAMDHIHLERWADLIVLCPTTANTLNKMANGISDDAVSTLFLAHEFKKPFLVAPAMNHAMYLHPTTSSSLRKLSEMGVVVLPPEEGPLACGEDGTGRLASLETLRREISAALHRLSAPSRKSVLVTFGGTEEPIDEVRTIANFSRGHTGAQIVEHLVQRGHHVVALAAEKSVRPKSCDQLYPFRSFQDLDSLLRKVLSENHFDFIIHLAAVSDFSVESVEVNGVNTKGPNEKISSSDKVSIHLKPNFKIVDRLKKYSNHPKIKVIAFKLTKTESIERRLRAIQKIARSEHVDFVVHNELSEIHGAQHRFRIFENEIEIGSGQSKNELVRSIAEIVERQTLNTEKGVPNDPMP